MMFQPASRRILVAHFRWLYQWEPSSMQKWCPDLIKPKYMIWAKLQIPLVLLSLVFGYFLFGWAGLFWLGAIRMVYSCTVSVSSTACFT